MERGRRPSGKSRKQAGIGEERIKKLFEMAGNEFKQHPERSDRYVRLARKMAMRYNIKIEKTLKRKICKKCQSYLVQGVNSTSRIRNDSIAVRCLKCGNVMRYPYRRHK